MVSGETGGWGPTRVLYLQHATDPVVFFSPDLLLERPDWLDRDDRHSEINDGFAWIPFVTMWQVLADMPAANSVPDGFGHIYSRQAQVAAWTAIIQPDNWTGADTDRLRQYFESRQNGA